MSPSAMVAAVRPRVTGERELEILQAALAVLGSVGYDRLTMDAVAARAKASKATLYRRWETKLSLVIDALHCMKGASVDVDTGDLRGDLIALFCAPGGLEDTEAVATMSAVLTAVHRDADFAEAFRRDIVEPKTAVSRGAWLRAQERGEIRADLDVELFVHALAGIVLHRAFVMGEAPDVDLVAHVLDQILLPAALCRLQPSDTDPGSSTTPDSSTAPDSPKDPS